MFLCLPAVLLRLATANHEQLNFRMRAMEFLKVRCQDLAGAAVRVREYQQDGPTAKVSQRALGCMQAGKLKIRRWGTSLQSGAFDSASGQGAFAEAVSAILAISNGRISRIERRVDGLTPSQRFQLVKSLFEFVEPQKHPPILAQELPAEPAPSTNEEPSEPND